MVSKPANSHQPGQRFAQDRVAEVPDVEGVVRVGLGIFDHHPLALRCAAAEVLALGQDSSTTRRAYSAVEKYRFR